jgi:hypothetical protein
VGAVRAVIARDHRLHRRDRTGHGGGAAGGLDGLAGQPHGGAVDGGDLVLAVDGREEQRAGGERVGDDQLGPGLEVGEVDVTDEVGSVEVGLCAPGGVVHGAAPALDLGAGAAVHDDDLTGRHPLQHVGHRDRARRSSSWE